MAAMGCGPGSGRARRATRRQVTHGPGLQWKTNTYSTGLRGPRRRRRCPGGVLLDHLPNREAFMGPRPRGIGRQRLVVVTVGPLDLTGANWKGAVSGARPVGCRLRAPSFARLSRRSGACEGRFDRPKSSFLRIGERDCGGISPADSGARTRGTRGQLVPAFVRATVLRAPQRRPAGRDLTGARIERPSSAARSRARQPAECGAGQLISRTPTWRGDAMILGRFTRCRRQR